MRLTALVIGNAAYTRVGSLANSTNDADDIAAVLGACGFTAIKKTNCTNKDMDIAVKDFRTALTGSDVGLFFFAGHGTQIDGENYLAAVDTDADSETDAKHSSLPLNRVIETMARSDTATNIIILDACRDNPFERAWHRSAAVRGLAPVYAPKGTIIAYATSPGQFASDGTGRNGAYTAALLKHINTPDCSLESMFKRVRNTLSAATNGKQISWEHTSLAGEYFFNLSLGASIDEYSNTALSDRLFVLDESKPVHSIVQDLKSNTWHSQNKALARLTAGAANASDLDTLFVLGRNIYQGACGGSNRAVDFLSSFILRTRGFAEEGRKAILDGILFEIFFDSRSQIREQPKNLLLDRAFDLQEYQELSASFAFTSECLLKYVDRFHAIPGKNRPVSVDVVTTMREENKYVLEQVLFEGTNIFWIGPDRTVNYSADESGYTHMSTERFEKQLSDQMVVPARLLTVAYQFEKNTNPQLLLPEGGTARKRRI